MRTCVVDLETTKLVADVGRILCGSILDHHTKEIVTYKTDPSRPYDDRKVCRQLRDHLSEYDIHVGWHIKGFDWTFLQSSLVRNDMNIMGRHFVVDPMYAARGWHGIKPRNSKLSTVAEFFDIDERKDDLDVVWWSKAMGGHKGAIDRLAERCESDVRITDEVYEELKPFIKRIERYGGR